MSFKEGDPKKGTTRLRQLLRQPGMLVAPGAHDVMTARLIEQTGFDALYLCGFATSASMLGVPDHSLITMIELLTLARDVDAVVDIPILSDIDDTGGDPLSGQRTIRLAEKAGIAGIHVKDLIHGKHSIGHKDRMSPVDKAVDRIQAQVNARADPDFVIIARTDGVSTSTFQDALERTNAYAEAGADVLFLTYLELRETQRAVDALPKPLLNVVLDIPKDPLETAGLKVGI